MPYGMTGITGTPTGSAASVATLSARIESVASERNACCSVHPMGMTSRSSCSRYDSTCCQCMSAMRMRQILYGGSHGVTHQRYQLHRVQAGGPLLDLGQVPSDHPLGRVHVAVEERLEVDRAQRASAGVVLPGDFTDRVRARERDGRAAN